MRWEKERKKVENKEKIIITAVFEPFDMSGRGWKIINKIYGIFKDEKSYSGVL